MDIGDLTSDRMQVLLYRLIKEGLTEELGKEFDVVIPARMNLTFKCPNCNERTSSKVLSVDMKGIKKYMTCPSCKRKAYIHSLGEAKDLRDTAKGLGRLM